MAHGFRALQHWNQWLTQHFLGCSLLQAEQKIFSTLLQQHYGKHALLIGVPHQEHLLDTSRLPYHTLIGPLIPREKNVGYVESDLHELPIMTGSMDLVMLPHTLEFVDNPRQLLSEACRIIKPEGLIILSGFNPYSAWGVRKLFSKHKIAPWSSNFIHSRKIKSWLQLADFAMEKQMMTLFRPPVNSESFYHHLHFLERIGVKCLPALSGVYVLVARAKVIPLTPIRLKWKQQLSGIRISSTMSGHIARQSDGKTRLTF